MKKILIFIFCLFLFSIVNAEEKEDLAPDAKSAIMIEASTGANRCNMFSILVEPINEKDIFITKVKRPIERCIMNRYFKKMQKEKE